jgi:citrate synthase
LVGHLAEEMNNPLGRDIWERIEEEVFENRDQ